MDPHTQVPSDPAIEAAVINALHKVLAYPADKKDEGTLLVQRIPLICADIRSMKDDMKEMRDNMTWAVRIVLGAVMLALLKLIFIP